MKQKQKDKEERDQTIEIAFQHFQNIYEVEVGNMFDILQCEDTKNHSFTGGIGLKPQGISALPQKKMILQYFYFFKV